MNDDLLAGDDRAIMLQDQIRCVEREINMRKRVYPHQVTTGKMTELAAQIELARMEAVLETLKALKWERDKAAEGAAL